MVGRWRDLCIQFMRTTLVSHGNILAAPVIGWVLCAPKYLVGTMSLGEAAQAVAAFVMVQTALNWLVDNYPGLAECLSSVNRVAALLLALDELDRDDEQQMDPMAVSGSRMPRTAHLPAVCQYSVGQAEEVVALRTKRAELRTSSPRSIVRLLVIGALLVAD